MDAAPLSDEVCGDPGKLRRVTRARPLHRLQVERRQRRWLRLRSVMDVRRRVNAHTPSGAWQRRGMRRQRPPRAALHRRARKAQPCFKLRIHDENYF